MILSTPDQIQMYRIATLRTAVRLEIRGIRATSKGRSASAIAKELLGLPRSTKRQDVLDALNQILA